VNGDGYNNDRAFVFRPGLADAAVGDAMRTLLESGSASARDCLSSQLGHLAARNSCQGVDVERQPQLLVQPDEDSPPAARHPLALGEQPARSRRPAAARRGSLRGWGQSLFPDQTLLYVRGFDPVSKVYKYEVNPRFGSTNPQFSQFRQPSRSRCRCAWTSAHRASGRRSPSSSTADARATGRSSASR